MNNKYVILGTIGVFLAVLIGLVVSSMPKMEDALPEDRSAEARLLVVEFGDKLKNVSLLGPDAEVKSSMDENYSPYVSADLLEEWKNEPSGALGRQTSSPYPDRIEVSSVVQTSEGRYEVEGIIVDETSTDTSAGSEMSRPIRLTVSDQNGELKIISFEMGGYDDPEQIDSVDISIEGEGTCLPHKDTSGPVTMECAYGLKTSNGSHYALGLEAYSSITPFDFQTGKRYKIGGELILSGDSDIQRLFDIYDIKGVVRVKRVEAI